VLFVGKSYSTHPLWWWVVSLLRRENRGSIEGEKYPRSVNGRGFISPNEMDFGLLAVEVGSGAVEIGQVKVRVGC